MSRAFDRPRKGSANPTSDRPSRSAGGTLYLCGAGNSEGVRLALNVEASARRFARIVLLDDDPTTHGRALLGVPVVGTFDLLSEADPTRDAMVNLVARTTGGRRRAGERLAASGLPFAPLVAPGVDVLGATFHDDVVVYAGATLGPETVLGPGCVVFMGAVVGHESTVGAGCVLASNAVLNARVVLEDGVYVGTNATVLPEIRVGAGATVGAGSVAMADVPAGVTVLGIPARAIGAPREGPAFDGPRESGGPASPAHAGPGSRGYPPFDPGAPDPLAWEDRVSAAWTEVLGRAGLPPDVPVFDLGADSLAALRVAEILRRNGADVGTVDLFRHPTIRGLARHLAKAAEPVVPSRPGASPAPSPGTTARGPSRPATTLDGPAGTGSPDADDLLDAVLEAFRRALGRADVYADSHFFDLGGDTSAAQTACELLRGPVGEPICFMQVVRRPTPREFADHLRGHLGHPPECVAQGVLRRLVRRAVTHGG